MKFKVGDRVRVVNTEYAPEANNKVTVITRIVGSSYELAHRDCNGIWSEGHLELVTGHPKKVKFYQFVVIYDRTSGDPHELFYTKKALIDWCLEAWDDTNIINDSIKVYRLGDELSVNRKVEINVRKKRI